MPDDKTIDFVVAFLTIGLVALGTLSVFVGWATDKWDRFVNRSQVRELTEATPDDADEQTDEQTDGVSGHLYLWQEFLLDGTRAQLITVMLNSDVPVGKIRSLLKGDNNVIADEVEQARVRLGISPPDRQLRVRDERGERIIPLR